MEATTQTVSMAQVTPLISEPKWRPWVVCCVATLFFFFEFIQGNMFNPLAPALMRDFQLDSQQLSILASTYFIANVIFLFPSGYLLDRYSTRKLILSAMWISVLATFLFAVSTNYWTIFVCRFLTGVGSAFCFISCIRLASRWFPARQMALVTGLIVTIAMTGGMVAQEPLNILIEGWGWRQALVVDGMAGLLFIFFIFLVVQDHPKSHHKEMQKQREEVKGIGFWQGLGRAFFKLQNVAAALYTCLMNTPIIVIGALAGSLFLQQVHHLNSHEAAIISMGVFAGTIVGGPLVGWWSDRIGYRRLPMIIGVIGAFALIVIMMSVANIPVWQWFALFFGLGFFSSTQVLSYPTVAESNPAILTATAVSVVGIITQGGAAIAQSFFGYLLKQNWMGEYANQIPLYSAADYHHAFLMIPIGFAVAFVAALVIKETNCHSTVKV